MSETIEVETVQAPPQNQTALAVRPAEGSQAVGKAMTVQEVSAQLAFIKEVMASVMKVDQDYGKIPGTGDKPSLLQPGAQKLLMTFRLTEEVQKETFVDLGNYHREVRYVVRVKSQTGMHWDGVGTCSTLEAKYRYRKASRKCPACGKDTIIQGKAEYGGGWICFAKKGGCGAKFSDDTPAITSQAGGIIEHDNPADFYNTVQKMSFKRALVHAAINATNTSELWTQDLEDMKNNQDLEEERLKAFQKGQGSGKPQYTPRQPNARPTPPSASNPPQSVQTPKPKREPVRIGSEKTRDWMISSLNAKSGMPAERIVWEYFVKLGQLLPTEGLPDLPLHFVPISKDELKALEDKIAKFEQGEEVTKAFEPHYLTQITVGKELLTDSLAKARQAAETPEPKPTTTPAPPDNAAFEAKLAELRKDPEWFMGIYCPVPNKGQKRDDYLKNPDTIGSMHYAAKEGNQEMQRRLWGFVNHYEAKGWTKTSGEVIPPNESDLIFREALDDFSDAHEKNKVPDVPDDNDSEDDEEDDIPM
jgi:hypothetical protein